MCVCVSDVCVATDLTFEEPKTPLESALGVLESLCRELDVPQREQQRVHNAITEMVRHDTSAPPLQSLE